MDLFDLDDVLEAAGKRVRKALDPGDSFRKGFGKEMEKPKKAFSYYKELHTIPPRSMKKGLLGKVGTEQGFAALATLGMARCSLLVGKRGEAEVYAKQLSSYPDEALEAAGDAILFFLEGNVQDAGESLNWARQNHSFDGEVENWYLSSLDRCWELFTRRDPVPAAGGKFGDPRKEKKREKKKELKPREPAAAREQPRAPTNQEVHHHHHVVVQNIGEYIAGGKLDIKDCVVQRSRLGNTQEGGLGQPGIKTTDKGEDASKRKCSFDEYKKLLDSVWKDGIVTDQEFEFLQRIRKFEGITLTEHLQAEMDIKQELAANTMEAPCPACGKQLQFVPEYNSWYCWGCKEYKQ
jgi:hypothetical protein